MLEEIQGKKLNLKIRANHVNALCGPETCKFKCKTHEDNGKSNSAYIVFQHAGQDCKECVILSDINSEHSVIDIRE